MLVFDRGEGQGIKITYSESPGILSHTVIQNKSSGSMSAKRRFTVGSRLLPRDIAGLEEIPLTEVLISRIFDRLTECSKVGTVLSPGSDPSSKKTEKYLVKVGLDRRGSIWIDSGVAVRLIATTGRECRIGIETSKNIKVYDSPVPQTAERAQYNIDGVRLNTE